MISLEQITGEISALEQETPTHETMRKLASLYTVRDHMVLQPMPTVTEDVHLSSGTEFAKAVEGKPVDGVMTVLDELMTTLQVINPKLYGCVMARINRE